MKVTELCFLIQSQPQSFCFCIWSVRFRHEISFAGRFWIFGHFDIHWSRPEIMHCWPMGQMQPADVFVWLWRFLFCFTLSWSTRQNLKFRVFYMKLSLSGTLGCISLGQVFCPETITWLALQMVCAFCRSPRLRLNPLHSTLCLRGLCRHSSLQSLA